MLRRDLPHLRVRLIHFVKPPAYRPRSCRSHAIQLEPSCRSPLTSPCSSSASTSRAFVSGRIRRQAIAVIRLFLHFLFQFRICISIANSSKRFSCVSQGFETLPSIFPSLSQHLSSFLFQYFSVRILFIVIDLFFPSVHSQFIHTTTFFFVEGMSPVGSSLHHQPSQITCHITSLADLLLRDQIVVPITGQILADTLSLSHHLSHFHSVLSTQTTSPL